LPPQIEVVRADGSLILALTFFSVALTGLTRQDAPSG
jgi:hypothetical protein